MTDGEIIRYDIIKFLKREGVPVTHNNIETIVSEHLNDPTDMHIKDLINSRKYMLDLKK